MKSMKTKILSLLIAFPLLLNAQINLISHFTWDNNPVSQADFGPDATSISASSFVDINGANNTNGLNAGNNPKKDINLILPGYHFDVDGIEVEIDFQREENSGNFFARGNCLKFGISSGKLRIQYRLSDGMGGYVQHTYTNLFSVPFDDTYRTYTFRYDPYTQEATVSVNSVEIWSKTESGQPLYWNGAGDMLIGSGLDGTGFNKTFLDNSKISEILPVILPVQFQILSIEPENSLPKVKWETVFEKNNSHFLVEKSYDGQTFEKIGEVSGAGNSNSTQQYSFLDENYNKGEKVYFRINQVDKEGKNTFSKTLSYVSEINSNQLTNVYPTLLNYPNQKLTLEFQSINEMPLTLAVYSINGKLISSKKISLTKGNNLLSLDSKVVNKGSYILIVENNGEVFSSKIVY